MAEELNSVEANEKLRKILSEEINKLLEAGKASKESGVTAGIKEIDPSSGKCILEAEEDKYNALNLLSELTDFGRTKTSQIYEFPGLSINGETTKLRIPMDKVDALAELGHRLENELSFLKFKLPTELFKYTKENKGKNLPGKDFPPPSPKIVAMTNDEYEEYLESYYETHGVKKEADEASFRRAYPHEKVDYSKANEEQKDFTNEYYNEQVRDHAKGKGTTTTAPIGKRIKVSAKSLKRPNIFNSKDKVEGTRKWEKIESFVIKAAAVAAGVFLAGTLISYNPAFLIPAAAVGSFALVRYLQKKAKIKKIGKPHEPEPTNEPKEPTKGTEPEKTKTKDYTDTKDGKDRGIEPTPEPKKDPAVQPKPVPGGTPSPAPGGTPNPNPNPEPKDQPHPEPQKPTADFTEMAMAEEELGLDQREYNRLTTEIEGIALEVNDLLKTATTEQDKERLEILKQNLGAKYAERLQIIYKLMNRQEKMLDDAGISFGR